jgi:hypothetical protein
MKALTLYQPHATLVARGAKRIETRSWKTSYRGPIAIHAAKNSPRTWEKLASRGLTTMPPDQAFLDELEEPCGLDEAGLPDLSKLPSGVIVALAMLVDVRPINVFGDPEGWAMGMAELAFGVYGLGRYAWFFDEILPLRAPYHSCRGGQRIWNLPAADYLAALDLAEQEHYVPPGRRAGPRRA